MRAPAGLSGGGGSLQRTRLATILASARRLLHPRLFPREHKAESSRWLPASQGRRLPGAPDNHVARADADPNTPALCARPSQWDLDTPLAPQVTLTTDGSWSQPRGIHNAVARSPEVVAPARVAFRDGSRIVPEYPGSKFLIDRTPRGLAPSERAPLVTQLFTLYATGEYSLKALTKRAKEIGLRHPRSNRPLTKSAIHRMLTNPIYTGDFRWVGKRRKGSHEALISHEVFNQVQAMLGGKPRPRSPQPKHPFMRLLTCGRCACLMTAERKKAKYVYYRCTGFRGRCGNTYIREEPLAGLLGGLIERIQIPADLADWIAEGLRDTQGEAERIRRESAATLTRRRRGVQSKLDRSYDDYLDGRISEAFWTRKSGDWESELAVIDAELSRLSGPTPAYAVTGAKILELAKNAVSLYKKQSFTEQRRLLDTVLSNCTFDRGTLCPTYTKPFDLLAEGNETGNWRWGQSPANPSRRDFPVGRLGRDHDHGA